MSTLDDFAAASDDVEDDDECDCDELPDGFPCAPCFITGAEDFGGEFA
jgi:hypothetical protein